MQDVSVRIDSQLRVRRVDLPPGAAAQIRERLTIANVDKEKAVERGDYGAEDMPDGFELWGDVGEDLVMMRGFAAELRAGLDAMGYRVIWDDRTVAPQVPLAELVGMMKPELSDKQEAAALDILLHRQGVLEANTGFGKTVVGLDCWRRAGTTGLIVVGNTGLAQQWRDRAEQHLGVETGLIGDGVWEERSLTIAMAQTLYRRIDDLDRERFWERWGMTLVDEAHHAISMSYREIISRILSRYLIGKTATPLEDDWRQRILLNVLGPIFHQTAEVKVTPLIKVVKTDFKWVPKTAADKRLRDSRAIYRRVTSALMEDRGRVLKIVSTIKHPDQGGCAQLVVCRSLDYIAFIYLALEESGYPIDRIFHMRGSESREQRAQVAEMADEGNCVILATVADEGTDIPRLDRLHLVWPQRKTLPVKQQIGRLGRKHPNKTGSVVFDYADFSQGVLRAQFYARKVFYTKSGYPVDKPPREPTQELVNQGER